MRVFYDTEFLEDGNTIELISIGIVTDDAREYYAVNSEMPVKRIFKHKWLMENVAPSLPLRNTHSEQLIDVDRARPEVKPRWVIANEVRAFILGTHPRELPYVELWADWAAYDHVALCQLWGSMMSLPEGIPMWTHDLRQALDHYGLAKEVPSMPGVTEHNALSDAREVAFRHNWLGRQL